MLKILLLLPFFSIFMFSCSSTGVDVDNNHQIKVSVTSNRDLYNPGDTIKIKWDVEKGTPAIRDCISINKHPSEPHKFLIRKPTNATEKGEIKFRAGGFDESYVARYYYKCKMKKSHLLAESEPFQVRYAD